MKRKQIIDLIIAIMLIIVGSSLLIFRSISVIPVKKIFAIVLIIYGILNLIQFILTFKSKDYEGLFTCIASIITLVIVFKLDVDKVPWYLSVALFSWIIMMSLIKLNKADYYNDRKNKVWILRVIVLILFILTGLLATINLYHDSEIQILILGFFYFIHGILELLDPITIYLIEKK